MFTWEREWYQDAGRANTLTAHVFKESCELLTVPSDMSPLFNLNSMAQELISHRDFWSLYPSTMQSEILVGKVLYAFASGFWAADLREFEVGVVYMSSSRPDILRPCLVEKEKVKQVKWENWFLWCPREHLTHKYNKKCLNQTKYLN